MVLPVEVEIIYEKEMKSKSKKYPMDIEQVPLKTHFDSICDLFEIEVEKRRDFSLQLTNNKNGVYWTVYNLIKVENNNGEVIKIDFVDSTPKEDEQIKTHLKSIVEKQSTIVMYLKKKPELYAREVMDTIEFGEKTQKNKILFGLKDTIQDSYFAEEFISQGGITILAKLVNRMQGNLQGYLLASMRSCLIYVSAMNQIQEKSPEVVGEIYKVTSNAGDSFQNPTIYKNAVELLIVFVNFLDNGLKLISKAAKLCATQKPIPHSSISPNSANVVEQLTSRSTGSYPYQNLMNLLRINDLNVQINTLTLLNVMLSKTKAEAKKKKLLFLWQQAGLKDSLIELNNVEYPEVREQLKIFQNISNMFIPRSWYICELLKKRLVDLNMKYEQIQEKLFDYQRQQPHVKLLKTDLLRAYETVEVLASGCGILCNTGAPVKRRENEMVAVLQSEEIVELSTLQRDKCSDLQEICKNVRKKLIDQFVSSDPTMQKQESKQQQQMKQEEKNEEEEDDPFASKEDDKEEEMNKLKEQVEQLQKKLTYAQLQLERKQNVTSIEVQADLEEDVSFLSIVTPKVTTIPSPPTVLPPPVTTTTTTVTSITNTVPCPPSQTIPLPPPISQSSIPMPPLSANIPIPPVPSIPFPPPSQPILPNTTIPMPPISTSSIPLPPPSLSSIPSVSIPMPSVSIPMPPSANIPPLPSSTSIPMPPLNASIPMPPLLNNTIPTPPSMNTASIPMPPLNATIPMPSINTGIPMPTISASIPMPPSSNMGIPIPTMNVPMPPMPPSTMNIPGGLPPMPPMMGMPLMTPKPQGRPKITPLKKMKPLFWDKVSSTQVTSSSNSVWKEIKEPTDINFEEFADLFQKKETDSKPTTQVTSSTATTNTPMNEELLDSKLTKNLSIMLHKMPKISVLQSAILQLDNSILKKDMLEVILQNMPEAEAVSEFKQKYKSKSFKFYSEAEKFMLMMINIPEFALRLKCWSFVLEYRENMDSCVRPIKLLEQAVECLSKSNKLNIFLGTVLALGNYMNGGTAKGQADGFQLSVLNRLDMTKDKTNKITLLQFIANYLRNKYGMNDENDFMDSFVDEFESIIKVKTINVSTLQSSIDSLSNGLKGFKNDVKKIQKVIEERKNESIDAEINILGDAEDLFMEKVKPFFIKANKEMEELEKRITQWKTQYISLQVRYGSREQDAEKSEPSEFFGNFSQFVEKYKQCVDVIMKNEAQANKKSGATNSRQKRKEFGQTINVTMAKPGEDAVSAMVSMISKELAASIQ